MSEWYHKDTFARNDMAVIYLKLHNYLPLFSQSAIETIEVTPHQVTQLVVGANGSGKSALMREWSPLPPDTDHFGPGGYKEVHYRHGDQIYKMRSHCTGKAFKHFFSIDGINNLNESAKVTEQRELVSRYLGYTSDLHAVLTGNIQFTKLSEEERRRWLARICPIDFTLTDKLYKFFREQHRDTKAIGRHLTSKHTDYVERLEAYKRNLPSDVDTQVEILQLAAESYLPFMRSDLPSAEQLIDSIREGIAILDQFGKVWNHYKPVWTPHESITDMSSLISHIGFIRAEELSLQKEIRDTDERIAEFDNLGEQLKEGILDKDVLMARIAFIESEMAARGFDGPPTVVNASQYRDEVCAWERKVHDAYETVRTLPPTDGYTVDELRVQLSKLTEHEFATNIAMEACHRNLGHLENLEHGDSTVTCPKCNSRFAPNGLANNTEEAISNERLTLKRLGDKLSSVREEKAVIGLMLRDAQSRGTAMHRLTDVVWNAPAIVRQLVSGLPTLEIIAATPSISIDFTMKVMGRLDLECEVAELYDELQRYRYALRCYTENNASPVEHLNVLRQKRADLIELWREKKKEIDYCVDLRRRLEFMFNKIAEANEIRKSVDGMIRQLTDAAISEVAKAKQFEVVGQLNTLRDMVNQRTNLSNQLELLKVEAADCEQSDTILQLCVDAFSPSKGIPAEQLFLFIEGMVAIWNSICAQLWNLPVEVIPCELDEGILSGKFPLKVESGTVSDISFASSGQQSMLNFALTMTLREIMGLKDYPLFMDEVGRDFDEAHKRKLVSFAKTLVQHGYCSQLYLVNHFQDTQSSLSNYEMIIIDDRNIIIPSSYETSAKITRGNGV